MFRWFSLLALGAMALVGCTQSSVVTTVAEDGSFSRSIKIEHSSTSLGEAESNPREELGKLFRLPTGTGWETTWSGSEGSAITFNAKRNFAKDEVGGGDLVALEKAKAVSDNSYSVKEVEPGVFEYREKILWTGDRTPIEELSAEQIAKVRVSLGEVSPKVTDEELKKLSKDANLFANRMMLGPTEPMLFSLISAPDFALKKMNRVLGMKMLESSAGIFGDRLTLTERRSVVRNLISALDLKSAANEELPDPTQPSDEDSTPSLITFAVTVQMPGEVIETNGEYDPMTGEVFWSFLSGAAAVEDFELVVRSKVSK